MGEIRVRGGGGGLRGLVRTLLDVGGGGGGHVLGVVGVRAGDVAQRGLVVVVEMALGVVVRRRLLRRVVLVVVESGGVVCIIGNGRDLVIVLVGVVVRGRLGIKVAVPGSCRGIKVHDLVGSLALRFNNRWKSMTAILRFWQSLYIIDAKCCN